MATPRGSTGVPETSDARVSVPEGGESHESGAGVTERSVILISMDNEQFRVDERVALVSGLVQTILSPDGAASAL